MIKSGVSLGLIRSSPHVADRRGGGAPYFLFSGSALVCCCCIGCCCTVACMDRLGCCSALRRAVWRADSIRSAFRGSVRDGGGSVLHIFIDVLVRNHFRVPQPLP